MLAAMTDVRFDDIDGLRAHVTEELGAFGPAKAVTQDMIDQFAELTGDHQWIHVDVDRAKAESPFGTTIAHGFLVLSMLPGLTAPSPVSITGFGSAINYGADKLRFIQPVPAGSEIQLRRRLADVTAKPKGTQVTVENEIRVVGSDKPALLYRSIVLYLPPRE